MVRFLDNFMVFAWIFGGILSFFYPEVFQVDMGSDHYVTVLFLLLIHARVGRLSDQ